MKVKMGMLAMLIIGLISGLVLSSTTPIVFAKALRPMTVQRVDVKLVINGKNSPNRPVIIQDISYLPVRAIAEVFNCDVDWDTDSRTVIVTQRPVEVKDIEN